MGSVGILWNICQQDSIQINLCFLKLPKWMSPQCPPRECKLLNSENRWGNDCRDKQVLSHWRKVDSDGADVMSAGWLFQTRGPATRKARVPIVDSLNGGTTRRLVKILKNIDTGSVRWCELESVTNRLYTSYHADTDVKWISQST